MRVAFFHECKKPAFDSGLQLLLLIMQEIPMNGLIGYDNRVRSVLALTMVSHSSRWH